MATTPNYGWTTPDDTNLVKNGASDIRTLANAIDSTVDSVDDRVDALESNAIQKSIIDAAGDLIVGTAADTVSRLAAGTNGKVLTIVAGTPQWAAPAGSDVWTLVTSVTPTAGASTVSFTALSGYSKYWIVTAGLTTAASAILRLRINGNAGSNYYTWYLNDTGNVVIGTGDRIDLAHNTGGTVSHNSNMIISNANQAVIKRVSYNGRNNTASTQIKDGDATVIETGVITSLELGLNTSTFNAAGTVYLYGVAA